MIRVVVVASSRLYREGLAGMLDRQDGLAVVGARPDRSHAALDIQDLQPDVVLLDMTTPQSRATIADMKRLVPGVPIVALGVPDVEGDVLACAEAGIAGYVTREASLEELVAVVRSAVQGELRCSPRIAAGLLRRLSALSEHGPSAPRVRLTARQREIVRLIGQDLSNKEIAHRLGIEVATVKNHVHNLLEKLNVHRRTAAVRLLGDQP